MYSESVTNLVIIFFPKIYENKNCNIVISDLSSATKGFRSVAICTGVLAEVIAGLGAREAGESDR